MVLIDEKRREVKVDGREKHLTPSEFSILIELKKADGGVLTKEQLWDRIRPEQAAAKVSAIVINQIICRLRRKLGKHRAVIKTVPWIGYKFNARG